jgi:hypothetical protein
MDYRSELECQLSALKEMIDSMSIDEKGLPLIEKDIILERLREVYSYVSACPIKTVEATATAAPKVEKPASEPLFAPPERSDEVEYVAQPIMDDVKDEGYENLFTDEPAAESQAPESTFKPEAEPTAEPHVEPEATVEEETVVEETPTPEPEVVAEAETTPADKEEAVPEPAPEPEPTPAPEPAAAPEQQKEQSEKTANQELSLFEYLSKNQEGKQPQTIGDRFEQNHTDLGDKLSQQVSSHKVSDLRTVININDKFSFVGALFHNNMRAYTDFILRLNAIDNRDEAINYISEVAQQYSWNMDSIEVKTFNKILDRKF